MKNTIGTKKMKFEKNGWIIVGLIWGIGMLIIMTFAAPMLRGEDVTGQTLIIDIPLWLMAGLGWGYFMKRFLMKQAAKNRK